MEARPPPRCGRLVRTVMFLLGASTRGSLRTAHQIARRNVPLCPPHVLRCNRAGESDLDAVFEVGDTNAGQSEPEDWTCPSRLAKHTGEFTGLHAIKRSKDDATRFGTSARRVANADQLTQLP